MKNFIIVIIVTLLLLLNSGVFAQESNQSVTATPSAKVEYVLPYPGILPDSPLYFLKALRDRIISLLIADPLKKTEFNLLQANKRLNAGVFLLKKEKDELALSTISKGENYFEMAINQVRLAKNKKEETKIILDNLSLATKKHQEVLQEVKEKIREDLKGRTERELERARFFEKSVEELRKQ